MYGPGANVTMIATLSTTTLPDHDRHEIPQRFSPRSHAETVLCQHCIPQRRTGRTPGWTLELVGRDGLALLLYPGELENFLTIFDPRADAFTPSFP